jgi:hypothetical protein
MDPELRMAAISRMLLLALAGALVVGLPSAVLMFWLIKDDAQFGFWKLALVANGFVIFLVSILALFPGSFAVVFFGVPTVLAANAFTVVGWFLVLKPYRAAAHV